MSESAPKKQKKKPLIIAAVCLLLFIIGGVAIWLTREDDSVKDDPLALDDNATMGVLPGIDIAERQAQL